MSEEARAGLTGGLWVLSALLLGALFISAAIMGEFMAAHIIFAAVILAIPIIVTPILLRWKEDDTPQEKAKRNTVDSIVSDLSDAELLELKQRLAVVESRDNDVLDYISDDGELVQRS